MEYLVGSLSFNSNTASAMRIVFSYFRACVKVVLHVAGTDVL